MLQMTGDTYKATKRSIDGFETRRRFMLQVHMYMSVTLVYNVYVPVAASADLRGQHSGAVAGRNTRGRVCSNSEETAKKPANVCIHLYGLTSV